MIMFRDQNTLLFSVNSMINVMHKKETNWLDQFLTFIYSDILIILMFKYSYDKLILMIKYLLLL